MLLNNEFKELLESSNIPSSDAFPHCIKVQQPFGKLDAVLSWCRQQYTNGTWGWKMETMPSADHHGMYKFYFDLESSAVAFALRWMN